MATLSDLTAAGVSDVLPGYVLSPPRLREWGEAESEAARRHMAFVRDSVAGLPVDVQRDMMAHEFELVKAGQFGMGMPHLDAFLRRAGSTLFAAWLCLRVKHPQLTREQVAELVTEDREADVARAVLGLFGLVPDWSKKNAEPTTTPSPQSPTGAGSSTSSEPDAG